ncbi:GNAT family N-acetyltransferase [Actinomycetaceae bacterium L2_0104]
MNTAFDRDDEVFMLETDRLLLRGWHEDDLHAWIEMNADADVRRYFPDLLTPETAIDRALSYQEELIENGFGLWAVQTTTAIAYADAADRPSLLPPNSFIGFIGLHRMDPDVPRLEDGTAVAYELGWRLAKEAWNQGLATEGAMAARDYAFGIERLPVVGSFTTAENAPSRRVMEKVGMRLSVEFTHPDLPQGYENCVLYSMSAQDWNRTHASED